MTGRAPDVDTARLVGALTIQTRRHGVIRFLACDRPGPLGEVRIVLPLHAPAQPRTRCLPPIGARALQVHLMKVFGPTADVQVEHRPDRIVASLRCLPKDLAAVAHSAAATLSGGPWLSEAAESMPRTLASQARDRAWHPSVNARAQLLHSLWPEVFDAYTPDDVERLDIDALPQLLHTLVRWDRVGLAVAGPGAFPALDTLASAEPSPIDNDAVVIAPGEDPPHADETHAGGNIVRLTDSRAAHTALRLGWRVPGRAHPHYTPLQMASLVLGGYFNSALTRRIRTDEALAYAPRALLDPLWEEAAFLIEVDTQSDKLIRCLTIIDEETAALIRPTPAQADALGHARRYALGTLALMLSSNAGVASTLATLLTSDLPATWLDTYASALQAVSVGDLAEAAKRHLDPSQRHGCAIGEPDRSADSPERVLEE